MKLALIFNPKAGKAETISEFLVELPAGQRCEVFPAIEPAQISQAAAQIVEAGFDRVVVGGGDGTLGHLVQCLAPEFPSLEIALLPVGTGNDLARSLGVSKLPDAVDAALRRPAILVDAVRLERDGEESWFMNVANGGLGGHVAGEVEAEDKKKWGSFAYWMSTASALADPQVYRCTVLLDDRELQVRALGLAIANGRFVGGGFPIAAGARMDDGLLNLVCVPELPALDLAAAGVDFTLGRNRESQRIVTASASRIELTSDPAMPFSVDGELLECRHLVFETRPGALRMVAGAKAPALGAEGETSSSLLPQPEEGVLAPVSALVPTLLKVIP